MYRVKELVINMKWHAADLEKYTEAKEYVDTVIIPLQRFQIENEKTLIEEAFQREVLYLFSQEIEKELSGRVLLTPEFNYLTSHIDSELDTVNKWILHLLTQPFNTVILLTFDPEWNKYKDDINGHVVWVPGIQAGDINSPEMKTIIKSQVQQISELIRSYW